MADPATRTKRFLGTGDLMSRWNVSKQFLERRLRADPLFPVPYRFTGSDIRKWTEQQIEDYEKIAIRQMTGGGE